MSTCHWCNAQCDDSNSRVVNWAVVYPERRTKRRRACLDCLAEAFEDYTSTLSIMLPALDAWDQGTTDVRKSVNNILCDSMRRRDERNARRN